MFNRIQTLSIFAATLVLMLAFSSVPAFAKEVKVFFLVGQSNMEGKGDPIHIDTYKDDPRIKPTYAGLKDGTGWKVRDDVFITYPSKHKGAKHGPLTVGYGTSSESSIGPEFGFGHAVGNALDEPVLLIKIAWGGKSLAVDFRPPGITTTKEEIEARLAGALKKNPKATFESTQKEYGHFYRETIRLAQAELAAIDQRFPNLKGHEVKIAGFIWHQGFNDIINGSLREKKYADYTLWLAQFIRDVRKDLNAPAMPFVIGELSTGGIPQRGDFQTAQAATAELPEFRGNVAFVPTAEYYDTKAQELFQKGYWKGTEEQKAQWRAIGSDRPYHYLGSGLTYYLKGIHFGKAALKMVK